MAMRKVVSIEITDVNTKICQIEYNRIQPKIYKSHIFEHAGRMIRNGAIADMRAYTKELGSQLKAAGITGKSAVFVLSGNKVLSREVFIPDMKKNLIHDYIYSQRDTYFPMDTTDYYFAHEVIEKITEPSIQLRVMTYAAPMDMVDQYQELAKLLKLKLISVDYNCNTLVKWLSKPNHVEMDYYLQINEMNCVLTILEKRKVIFQRSMSFGVQGMITVMREMDDTCQKLWDSDIYKRLQDEEILYSSFNPAVSYNEDSQYELRKRVTDALMPLVTNISRAFDYYFLKYKGAKIAKIHVGGVGAKIKGIIPLLESEFSNIRLSPVVQLPGLLPVKEMKVLTDRGSEFISCIGGAESGINLLPKNYYVERTKLIAFYGILLGVTAVSSIMLIMSAKGDYDIALKEKTRITEELAQARYIEPIYAEYQQSAAAMADIQLLEDSAFTHGEYTRKLIDELEVKLPAGTLIHSFSVNEEQYSMNLTVPAKTSAALLLMQIQSINYIDDVTLTGISEMMNEGSGGTSVSFAVSGTLKKPDAEKTAINYVTGEEP